MANVGQRCHIRFVIYDLRFNRVGPPQFAFWANSFVGNDVKYSANQGSQALVPGPPFSALAGPTAAAAAVAPRPPFSFGSCLIATGTFQNPQLPFNFNRPTQPWPSSLTSWILATHCSRESGSPVRHLLGYHGQPHWYQIQPGVGPDLQKAIQELLKHSKMEFKELQVKTKPIETASKRTDQQPEIRIRRQG